MATQLEQQRARFDSMTRPQQAQFIRSLKDKLVESKNFEYRRFLNECIQKYNGEARASEPPPPNGQGKTALIAASQRAASSLAQGVLSFTNAAQRAVPQSALPSVPAAAPSNAGTDSPEAARSYFDGGLLSLIGWRILGNLITAVTLGICYPWALCMVYGWQINHTVIEGRRLRFNGRAVGLWVNWIKWLFFCIITLGIYTFWLRIALEKWKVKNTSFAD